MGGLLAGAHKVCSTSLKSSTREQLAGDSLPTANVYGLEKLMSPSSMDR